jgi:hypothetical protein
VNPSSSRMGNVSCTCNSPNAGPGSSGFCLAALTSGLTFVVIFLLPRTQTSIFPQVAHQRYVVLFCLTFGDWQIRPVKTTLRYFTAICTVKHEVSRHLRESFNTELMPGTPTVTLLCTLNNTRGENLVDGHINADSQRIRSAFFPNAPQIKKTKLTRTRV